MISERITKLRLSRGWSKHELGRRLNAVTGTSTGQRCVVYWETANGAPSLQYACALATVFGITLDELCERDTPPYATPSPHPVRYPLNEID